MVAVNSVEDENKGVPIRSISRALKVLQIINREGSICLMDISRKANLPYPTACRVVQTLVHERLIEKEVSRKHYRATINVLSLSYGYQDDDELVRVARPHIEGLTRLIGWPVSIVTRVGKQMVIRDSTHAMTTLTFAQYHPGYSMPMAYCAAGKAFLSALPEDEFAFVTAGLGPRLPVPGDPHCRLDPLQDMPEIREKGFAIVRRVQHTSAPGKTSAVSMPIFRKSRVVGAMTVAYFASALDVDAALHDILEPLRAARDAVTERLSSHHGTEIFDRLQRADPS